MGRKLKDARLGRLGNPEGFHPSERVAIGRALEAQIKATVGERRGRPSSEPDTPPLIDIDAQDKVENLPHLEGRKTREIAAKKAGFGNDKTYRDARKVVDKGAPELVQAMDAGEVSISAAAEMADLPPDEQREIRQICRFSGVVRTAGHVTSAKSGGRSCAGGARRRTGR